MNPFVIFLLALLCTLGFGALAYIKVNGLHKTMLKEWSTLDVMLRFRREIIKNLTEICERYANVTKDHLNIADIDPDYNIDARSEEEINISHSLTTFFNLACMSEGLKKNEDFVSAVKSLTKCEAGLNQSVNAYNYAVRDYNTMISIFPVTVIAKMFDLDKASFFDFESSKIKFNK